jgi:beta-lactamase regulating signal transducer with metallopeptidase domain
MSLLLALSLRGTLAFLLVEGADRIAARFAPGQGHLGRRLAWILAALVFLVPLHSIHFAVPGARLGLAAWAAGAVIVLVVAMAQTVVAQRCWSRMRLSTDSRLLTLLEDAKAESGVTAPIGLVVSDAVPAPALLGWLRPRILLPATLAAALPPERLRAIFLHELAHFRALDVPVNLLFTLVQAAHWFNPLAWLASRSWDRFREEAADAAALRRMENDLAYGETLLETLRHASAPVPYGAVGMGESLRNLKWRLTMIGRYRNSAPRPAWTLLIPALALAAAVVPLPAQSATDGKTVSSPDAADPAKQEAVMAMLAWAAVIDRGDYGQSWDQAAPEFQDAVTQADWIAVLTKVRPPLGKCLDRSLASAVRQTDAPLANGKIQEGDWVIAQFNVSYKNMKYAIDTLSFKKGEDGKWRAEGYTTRPQ